MSDLDAAEALVKMVSESRDTPMIFKILSKQESPCTPVRSNSMLVGCQVEGLIDWFSTATAQGARSGSDSWDCTNLRN